MPVTFYRHNILRSSTVVSNSLVLSSQRRSIWRLQRLVVIVVIVLAEIGVVWATSTGRRNAPVNVEFGSFAPVVVTRAMWHAKPALSGMSLQQPAGIILHNTGVESNPKIPLEMKMRNLQSFSQN